MSTDPNRATFVQQEYRRETVQDLNIRATYPAASVLVHDTHLGASDAAILAAAMFAEGSVIAQAFKVSVEGTYDLETIEGGPPRFILNAPDYVTDGRASKVTEIESDPWNEAGPRTSFVVRG